MLLKQKWNQWTCLQECLASVEISDRKRCFPKEDPVVSVGLVQTHIYIYHTVNSYIMIFKRCDIPIYLYIYTLYTYFVWEDQRHRYAYSTSTNRLTHMRTNLISQKGYCTSGRLVVLEACYSKIYFLELSEFERTRMAILFLREFAYVGLTFAQWLEIS